LIKFLMDNEYDIQNVMINRNKLAAKIADLAFNQKLKRKVVVRYVHENPHVVRIYVKGAPEEVLKLCSYSINKDVKALKMTPDLKESILNNIVDEHMASEGQKVLSFAFKEVKISDMQALKENHDEESKEFRKWCEADLIYLGTFGMNDPVRPNVYETIETIKFGKDKDRITQNMRNS
jgi:magnesium-transporting ATPase (P-type)